MHEEMGWSRTVLTGAYSLGLLVSALAAPLAGLWLDRHGPRGLMTLGSALGSALLLVWASVEDLWAFYLMWAGIGLTMAATLYEPAFAVLAKWFERGRARAFLLVTLAGGLASTIFLPLSAWVVGGVARGADRPGRDPGFAHRGATRYGSAPSTPRLRPLARRCLP